MRAFWPVWMSLVLFVLLNERILDLYIYAFPDSVFGYQHRYGVRSKYVFIQRQPHDCEWGSAPLGDKHCHYDKTVAAVRVENSSDGKFSYVSYDEGKTWVDQTRVEDKVEPYVQVWWTKVGE